MNLEELKAEVERYDATLAKLRALPGKTAKELADHIDRKWCEGDTSRAVLTEMGEKHLAIYVSTPRRFDVKEPDAPEVKAAPEAVEWDESDHTAPEGSAEWDESDLTPPEDAPVGARPIEPVERHWAMHPDASDKQRAEDLRVATKLYRIIDTLGTDVPPILFAGYMQCWRLANWTTGKFSLSHLGMSTRLGSKGPDTGQRVLQTLEVAGLIKTLHLGGPGHATLYRLMPLSQYDQHRVLAAVVSTWLGLNPSRWEAAKEA